MPSNSTAFEIYPDLNFSHDAPVFYTSFVSTIDGKIFVDRPGYWPIGSKLDYEVFTYLRAYSDLIIDGKNTALKFANRTIETIHREDFQEYREKLGIQTPVQYGVISSHPEGLENVIQNKFGFMPLLFTTKDSEISDSLQRLTTTVRFETDNYLQELTNYVQQHSLHRVFVDGGAKLVASLLKEQLLTEIFLTISPKIYGNSDNAAVTMVEGILFPSQAIPQFEIITIKNIENEIFVHYKRKV